MKLFPIILALALGSFAADRPPPVDGCIGIAGEWATAGELAD
jgi:hypothetical protein